MTNHSDTLYPFVRVTVSDDDILQARELHEINESLENAKVRLDKYFNVTSIAALEPKPEIKEKRDALMAHLDAFLDAHKDEIKRAILESLTLKKTASEQAEETAKQAREDAGLSQAKEATRKAQQVAEFSPLLAGSEPTSENLVPIDDAVGHTEPAEAEPSETARDDGPQSADLFEDIEPEQSALAQDEKENCDNAPGRSPLAQKLHQIRMAETAKRVKELAIELGADRDDMVKYAVEVKLRALADPANENASENRFLFMGSKCDTDLAVEDLFSVCCSQAGFVFEVDLSSGWDKMITDPNLTENDRGFVQWAHDCELHDFLLEGRGDPDFRETGNPAKFCPLALRVQLIETMVRDEDLKYIDLPDEGSQIILDLAKVQRENDTYTIGFNQLAGSMESEAAVFSAYDMWQAKERGDDFAINAILEGKQISDHDKDVFKRAYSEWFPGDDPLKSEAIEPAEPAHAEPEPVEGSDDVNDIPEDKPRESAFSPLADRIKEILSIGSYPELEKVNNRAIEPDDTLLSLFHGQPVEDIRSTVSPRHILDLAYKLRKREIDKVCRGKTIKENTPEHRFLVDATLCKTDRAVASLAAIYEGKAGFFRWESELTLGSLKKALESPEIPESDKEIIRAAHVDTFEAFLKAGKDLPFFNTHDPKQKKVKHCPLAMMIQAVRDAVHSDEDLEFIQIEKDGFDATRTLLSYMKEHRRDRKQGDGYIFGDVVELAGHMETLPGVITAFNMWQDKERARPFDINVILKSVSFTENDKYFFKLAYRDWFDRSYDVAGENGAQGSEDEVSAEEPAEPSEPVQEPETTQADAAPSEGVEPIEDGDVQAPGKVSRVAGVVKEIGAIETIEDLDKRESVQPAEWLQGDRSLSSHPTRFPMDVINLAFDERRAELIMGKARTDYSFLRLASLAETDGAAWYLAEMVRHFHGGLISGGHAALCNASLSKALKDEDLTEGDKSLIMLAHVALCRDFIQAGTPIAGYKSTQSKHFDPIALKLQQIDCIGDLDDLDFVKDDPSFLPVEKDILAYAKELKRSKSKADKKFLFDAGKCASKYAVILCFEMYRDRAALFADEPAITEQSIKENGALEYDTDREYLIKVLKKLLNRPVKPSQAAQGKE